jgi:transcription elongation GreA/GreB family factor
LLARLERMGIAPVGGEPSSQIYTEHRVIEPSKTADQAADQGLSEAAQTAAAAAGHPVLATVNERTSGESQGGASSSADVTADGNEVVEAGDTVIVRFADNDEVRRFRLTDEANDPGAGEVNVARPVAAALLENGVEDEVEIVVDGRSRRVVIEKIDKAA